MENKEQKTRLKKHPTQCDRMLAYIEKNGSISTMQAIMELGIVNPAARILELKAAGVKIVTTMTEGRNRYNEHCRYAVYKMVKGGA